MGPERTPPLRAIDRLRGDRELGGPVTGYALLTCGHRLERAAWPAIETTEAGWPAMRCRHCAEGGKGGGAMEDDGDLGEIAVWWLPPAGLRQLVAGDSGTVDLWPRLGIPPYIGRELRSAGGRAGHGRLWVPREIGIERIHWSDASPNAAYCRRCPGIVVRRGDLELLRGLPGLVTDAWLATLVPAPAGEDGR